MAGARPVGSDSVGGPGHGRRATRNTAAGPAVKIRPEGRDSGGLFDGQAHGLHLVDDEFEVGLHRGE